VKTPNLFKNNRPVIREFKPVDGADAGDLPYIWDAYKSGYLKELPEDMSMDDFLGFTEEVLNRVQEAVIVEDFIKGKLEPVAFVVSKNDGWLLEPHVQYFKNASPRNKLRTYVAFLKKTKYRKDIGACLVRVPTDTKNLTNHIEQYGLLEYVGKIWNGTKTGNEYLYSVRCKRNPVRSH